MKSPSVHNVLSISQAARACHPDRLRADAGSEWEWKDPENVSPAMPLQGVLTKNLRRVGSFALARSQRLEARGHVFKDRPNTAFPHWEENDQLYHLFARVSKEKLRTVAS